MSAHGLASEDPQTRFASHIGSEIGISVGTVRHIIHRTAVKLNNLMEPPFANRLANPSVMQTP